MRRIDDPSAAAALPTPEAAGTEGYFTEGSPGVTNPTLVRASWLNMIQEELRNIVVDRVITPSKTAYNQLLLAIKDLVQKAEVSYGVDTGTANTYTVAYTPTITAAVDGLTLRFKAKTANTGASTFSPNAVTAAPIRSNADVPLTGGEIVANQDVWVQWNSSFNAAAGAWVLLSPPQATETVKGIAKIGTQALTDAGTDDTTIVTPKKLRWGFTSSLTASGYIVFPSWLGGWIVQWGQTIGIAAAATGVTNLPIAFPTAALAAFANYTNLGGAAGSTGNPINVFLPNLSQVSIVNGGSGASQYFYLVIGK